MGAGSGNSRGTLALPDGWGGVAGGKGSAGVVLVIIGGVASAPALGVCVVWPRPEMGLAEWGLVMDDRCGTGHGFAQTNFAEGV
jgi:hypothetical protein